MTGSSGSSYIGSVRVSNSIAALAPPLQYWVAKCFPSSSFTNSNLAASFVLPIVKTWSSIQLLVLGTLLHLEQVQAHSQLAVKHNNVDINP